MASFVPPCKALADIGTDHAYIPIYLVKEGTAKYAVASDVAKGPAEIALSNVKKHNLCNKIDVVIGNGLDMIIYAEVIVLSGMGGKTICEILQADLPVARRARLLVIQPMTELYKVRKFLHEKCFTICDEAIAKEGNKLYNIIAAENGAEQIDDRFYYHIGKKLIEKRDVLLGALIEKKVSALNFAICALQKSSGGTEKMVEYTRLRKRFLEVYRDYCS